MAVEKTLPSFTTIIYKTSDGENCSATKNNGVVTIQGDKNGVRQMPLDEFMPCFLKDQAKKVKLDKTPEKDTVSFSNKQKKNLNGDIDDLKVKDSFWSSKRNISGTINGKTVNFEIKPNFWGTKYQLLGDINGRTVDLTKKGKEFNGELSDQDNDLIPYLRELISDKINYDNMQSAAACMAFCKF